MTDAVIVLGAAVVAPGVPGPALRRRVDHAVRVFLERKAAHLVVSGGIVTCPPAEALMMREIAVSKGVPEERVIVEDRSRNTFENAVYTGRIIRDQGWRDIVLVTDAFHIQRALYVFHRLGLPAVGAKVPRQPETPRWEWYRSLAEEQIRLVHSAALFLVGRHKPVTARVWGLGEPG
jgi:uncharacterized SAM-binding protein YcdF (DUF218 family)